MSNKFEIGKTYTARSACDHDCIFSITALSRTDKFVTFQTMHGEKRCKVKEYDGVEIVYALGQYSMAPSFRAA
jgi:hypothetical protein